MDLSETRFAAVKTVGDLERMLHGKLPPRAPYHYPAWVQRWPTTWVRLVIHYLLLRPAVFLLGWPRIRGRENLRGLRGPVLVVCNHIDDVDVGFVQTALPARFRHRLATATGGEALEALRTPPSGRSLLGQSLWPGAVGPGSLAAQPVSPAPGSWISRELRFRWRVRGPGLQHSGLSRRTPHHGWKNASLPRGRGITGK